MKLTTRSNLLPRLMMCRVIPQIPYLPLWRAKRQLQLYCRKCYIEFKNLDTTVKAEHVLLWMFADNFSPSCTVYSKFSSMGTKIIFRENIEEPLFRSTGNLPSV